MPTPQKGPGASVGEWVHFADILGLTADLLPCVANTDAKIAPYSKLKSIGKVPSRYNNGEVVGVARWTSIHATTDQVTSWSENRDYSICLQTRDVRAIDIDIDDLALAGRIRACVVQELGALPARTRAGAGRLVLACRVAGPLEKRVVHTTGGDVELLADGQQFIVAGTHVGKSGPTGRYFWEGGLPAGFPVIAADDLARCLDRLESEFGLAGIRVGVEEPARSGLGRTRADRLRSGVRAAAELGLPSAGDDEVGRWLDARGWTRTVERGRAGELLIYCPWSEHHTSDSGETECVYYPAGTGGFEQGHFKCLHAHCAHRSDADFLQAIGFRFSMLQEIQEIDDDHAYEAGRHTGARRDHGAVPAGGVLAAGDRAVAADRPGDLARADRLGDGGPALGQVVGRLALPAPDAPAAQGAREGDRDGGKAPAVPQTPPVIGLPADPVELWHSGKPGQTLAKGKKGFTATVRNLSKALRTLGWWRVLARDTFGDVVVWSDWQSWAAGAPQWRAWADEDYTRLREQLELDGFEPVGVELARAVVLRAADERRIDTAQEWLGRLRWDGVPRVRAFCSAVLGCEDGPYAQAVGEYLWTALAGRVLVPGVKADMVPVLVGEETGGEGKTTSVARLAPGAEFACRVDLQQEDEKTARKLRGTLVAEIAEVRGIATRDSQAIKDFLSAESDRWTPKYVETARTVMRRCVFVGTTDNESFLQDDVANFRRWLPLKVRPAADGGIDLALLEREREQLWAEGADLFLWGGVAWREAQRLARGEHERFVFVDDWTGAIETWLTGRKSREEGAGAFTAHEALTEAVGLPSSSVNSGSSRRIAKILRALGCRQGWVRYGVKGWRIDEK